MTNNRNKSAKKVVSSTFKRAVESTESIPGAYQPGIQALKAEHRRGLNNGQVATGSIDLDSAIRTQFPQDHRWDYGIGIPDASQKEKVLWLEVHHAASGETERVIRKLESLKSWLREHSSELNALPKVFVWQLSNKEHSPNDRRKRNQLAAKHGLKRVQGVVDLASI
jgi:hypothetical protein